MSDPEINLWAAVLGRAIDDLCYKKKRLNETQEYWRNRALLWFNNVKRTDPGSFQWVCVVLGLDYDQTRSVILSGKRIKYKHFKGSH